MKPARQKKRIAFLYAEQQPFLEPLLQELVERHQFEVLFVYWDLKTKTPFRMEPIHSVNFIKRSTLSNEKLNQLLREFDPNAIVISGWMDRMYLRNVIRYRRRGTPVITGFDDWWVGGLRQFALKLISPMMRQLFFSHAWIAGPRQYEFAKRIGFKDNHIIFDLLSANTKIFNPGNFKKKRDSKGNFFLYVGRFSPEKGISTMVNGYERYRSLSDNPIPLVCIGGGPERSVISAASIQIEEFSTSKKILEYMEDCVALVLPSDRDFFGVVAHEAASCGIPLILSRNVGCGHVLLIDAFNGYYFPARDPKGLADVFLKFEKKSTRECIVLGRNSEILAARISPEVSAASLNSVVDQTLSSYDRTHG